MTHSIDWAIEVRSYDDPKAKKAGAGHSFSEYGCDVRIEYDYRRGSPAVLYGDNPQPADPAEVEITGIETLPVTSASEPMKADHLTWQIVDEEFRQQSGLYDAMVDNAEDTK